MAHYVKLNEKNVVVQILSVNNEVITKDGQEIEQLGIDFLIQLYDYKLWKKTSFNANSNGFRFNFAAIGDIYDPNADAFYAQDPKCHDERILDVTTYRWTCGNPDHDVIVSE